MKSILTSYSLFIAVAAMTQTANAQRGFYAQPGWDVVNDSNGYDALNCHQYTLQSTGIGSARFDAFGGNNIIKTSFAGVKQGWVCFNGLPRLELGKLNYASTSVSLRIEGFGEYRFEANDEGNELRNNWYRKYMNLEENHNPGHGTIDRNIEGWDIDRRIASQLDHCYEYRFEAIGGEGVARINGLPGQNYIRSASNGGVKEGWVCFKGYKTGELNKFNKTNMSVSLEIFGFGRFSFESGDAGNRYEDYWYRKNIFLEENHNSGHGTIDRNIEGWDIDERIASQLDHCYEYRFEVVGGEGVARINGLPGQNYIRSASNGGVKEGWVCFKGTKNGELNKFNKTNMSVILEIFGFGNFKFQSGDAGNRYEDYWYRKNIFL